MSSVGGVSIIKGKGFAAKRASAANSFNEALGAGGSLTGLSEEVSVYPDVSVSILTDESGTIFLEQSMDETNWDSSEGILIIGSVDKVTIRPLTRRFHRTRFVSSSASPHVFVRIQTMYGSFIDVDKDALSVKIPPQQLFTYHANGQVEFYGTAQRGHAETDSAWTITKATFNSSNQTTKVKVAPPSSKWSERATLTYA